jgi:hypothetical protein
VVWVAAQEFGIRPWEWQQPDFTFHHGTIMILACRAVLKSREEMAKHNA